MRARRYTVLIADRSSGVVRRVTISLWPTLAGIVGTLMLPVLIGLGAKWGARAEMEEYRVANATLLEENGSYRATTGSLTGQIQALQGRDQRPRHPGEARSGPGERDAEAARHREGAGRRRQSDEHGGRRHGPADRVHLAGGYLRRASGAARRSRKPPAERTARTSSGGKRSPRRRPRCGRPRAG